MTKQENAGLPSVISKLTDVEFAKLKKRVTGLFQEHDELVGMYRSLVASRQAYSLVRYYLAERLEALGESWDTGAEELILQLTAQEADKSFNLADISRGLEGFLVPLLREKLVAELESDEALERVEARRAEELRALSPVPIELTFDLAGFPSELYRDQTLVIVGDLSDVDTELASILSALRTRKQEDGSDWTAIHLSSASNVSGVQPLSRRNAQETILKRTIEDWRGFASRRSVLHKKLDNLCSYVQGKRCDVLVIDDGFCLVESDPLLSRVADGIRAVRRWCDEHKAATVVGLPTTHGEALEEFARRAEEVLGKHYKVVCADGSK